MAGREAARRTDPKNIWLVGVQYTSRIAPLALHFNGAKWTPVPVPAGMAQLYDVVLRNNRPVAVGERFEADNSPAKPYVLRLAGSKFVPASARLPQQAPSPPSPPPRTAPGQQA